VPVAADDQSKARLGRPPGADERVWVGTVSCHEQEFTIAGALGPWQGDDDVAQLLLLESGVPRSWLYMERAAMASESERDGLLRSAYASLATADDRPNVESRVSMDVVVCTRDRPQQLARCLERLVKVVDSDVGVIVVDNAPSDDAVKDIVAEAAEARPGVRRVVEARPGLSRARNAALRASDADVIAFTDDDTVVDRDWTTRLRAAFSYAGEVGVVTGLVAPAEIAGRAQALFEKKVKWSERLDMEIYAMAERDKYPWAFPYAAGNFGTGANFAVGREIALSIGGFDEALGAGTKSGSGEDFKMFIQVVRAGHQLVYEPGAIVWHIHRSNETDLRRQVVGYGRGMAACFVSLSLESGRRDMLRGVWKGARALTKARRNELGYGMPRVYLALEALGVMTGPFHYAVERMKGR
jgi:GT2 family glycosyltransferase